MANESAEGGHVCYIYATDNERTRLLVRYMKEGLDSGEMCLLVVPGDTTDTIQRLQAAGLDAAEAYNRGALRVYDMEPTYLPQGRFVTDFMLQNIDRFREDAKQAGFTGLRTAGEMSWLDDHPEFVEDAIGYEDNVNRIAEADPHFIGLCLYPVKTADRRLLDSAAGTHPSYVYDGKIIGNPSYRKSTRR